MECQSTFSAVWTKRDVLRHDYQMEICRHVCRMSDDNMTSGVLSIIMADDNGNDRQYTAFFSTYNKYLFPQKPVSAKIMFLFQTGAFKHCIW